DRRGAPAVGRPAGPPPERQRRPAQARGAQIAQAQDRVTPTAVGILIGGEPLKASEKKLLLGGDRHFAVGDHERKGRGGRRKRAAGEPSLPMACRPASLHEPCRHRVDCSVERVDHGDVASVRWPSASRPWNVYSQSRVSSTQLPKKPPRLVQSESTKSR